MPAVESNAAKSAGGRPWRQPSPAAWLPVALLGACLIVGVALWAEWGFAIAFEAIRTYCF